MQKAMAVKNRFIFLLIPPAQPRNTRQKQWEHKTIHILKNSRPGTYVDYKVFSTEIIEFFLRMARKFFSSPPYKGGVAAASADGVVLSDWW
jgi:hypothetical protein